MGGGRWGRTKDPAPRKSSPFASREANISHRGLGSAVISNAVSEPRITFSREWCRGKDAWPPSSPIRLRCGQRRRAGRAPAARRGAGGLRKVSGSGATLDSSREAAASPGGRGSAAGTRRPCGSGGLPSSSFLRTDNQPRPVVPRSPLLRQVMSGVACDLKACLRLNKEQIEGTLLLFLLALRGFSANKRSVA